MSMYFAEKRLKLFLRVALLLFAWQVSHAEPLVPEALTLADALRFADANHVAVQLARQQTVVARGQVLEARAAAWPQLDVRAQYTRLDEVATIPFGDRSFSMGQQDNYEAVAEVRQILYAGGGVNAARSLARAYEGASAAELAHARHLTTFAVHRDFYAVLLAREHVRVAAQAVAWAERNRVDVAAKLRQGAAREFDLLRAESQVSQSEADLIAAENAKRKARMGLLRLLGLPLDAPVEILGTLQDDIGGAELPDAFALAMAHRPDLVVAREMKVVQEEALRVARSEGRPTVVAFGQGKYANPDRSSADAWEDRWMAGVRVEMSLFDGGRTRGSMQQARARLRQAELQLADLVSQVRLEIAEAEVDRATAQRLVAALAQHVNKAEAALELARRAYAEGVQEQIDVITAQLALMQSKQRYAAALYQQTMANRALELAAGVVVGGANE